MTTLLSFLGRARRPSPVGEERGYPVSCYRFDSGNERTTPLFGIALAAEQAVDRVVFIGTAGSMWDFFIDEVIASDADSVIELCEAVDQQVVDEAMLEEYRDRIGARLGLAAEQVECRIIPRAQTLEEQLGIVDCLAKIVVPKEELVLDVTHGFRHLPMLALVAARYLEKARGVHVREICYGAREMADENRVAPVVTLTGMLRIFDWIDALTLHDKSGNYSMLAGLLEAEGLAPSDTATLQRAAFQEGVNNFSDARDSLGTAVGKLRKAELGPLARLFREPMLERFEWTRSENDGAREFALARVHLAGADYLRATSLILEGTVTRSLARSGGNAGDARVRDEERESLRKKHETVRALITLRNAVVHGVRADDRDEAAVRALKSEATMDEYVRSLLKRAEKLNFRR